ncbi:MAG: gamma-glutamyl-gamma-aminobutyrate hydrolase family protein [Clostridia bacterium]|nr:gamma-glutamyl-gamma-aminobutyrate hydrolase family protein [Clostridia bacterium]
MVKIGIVPTQVDDMKESVSLAYPEAVLAAGGLPVLFPVSHEETRLALLLSQVDGLLLTGGGDVEPALYGEERLPVCGEASPERDAMEFPLLRMALARKMPVLAICRGMQVLCAALGGTLYQDLPTQFSAEISHSRMDRPADPIHPVRLLAGTKLAVIIGTDTLDVNTRHHQGAKTLPDCLIPSAVAPDGLVEGIELTEYPFAVGVQWHPESMQARYPLHRKIFDAFIRACEASAAQGLTD